MTKESLYLEFIQELIERMDKEKIVELHRELTAARSELLSDFYNCVAVQGLKSDCDLVAEAKQKIEVLNELMTKAYKLI